MTNTLTQLKEPAKKIKSAKSILLTTHKMCDGDGLGSLLGMYHAFKKINKNVRALTVDRVSNKYHFLSPEKWTESFYEIQNPIEPTDIALIFDTNDHRRVQPLYEELEKKCREIIFVDHHPILTKGPKPSAGSIVDSSSASTGQICYFLLKELGIPLDPSIALALYTSIVFDTQRFRFIRNSSVSHALCADLCSYVKNTEEVYNQLFGMTSLEKINFLSRVIQKTEYFHQNKTAFIEIDREELKKDELSIEDACDFLDITLEVETTQLSILVIQLEKNKYKLSFRSKGWDVSKLAEVFGGGGHLTSSGALLTEYTKNPKEEILQALSQFEPIKQFEPKKMKTGF